MATLKELTWEHHQRAERSNHARKLIKGMTPHKYHRYLFNQYLLYAALEEQAAMHGVLKGIEGIVRTSRILADVQELEREYNIKRESNLVCPVVDDYNEHVKHLDKQGLLAHIYVRHFGDMYGGQIIKQKQPGSGTMYEFDNVEDLKVEVRSRLDDSMADEAKQCFEFAIQLFKELDVE